ncbi:MAG: Ig-like domain-containing protein [Mycolicibacterium sp.]|uniref:Ig-like domain-containing protein n=1 Tax=Mycolicibacterium sp. TaxID=2320850 RepID=UPI003D0E0E61
MATGRDAGRVVGVAVSVGVGVGIAIGGLGPAAADSSGASASVDSADAAGMRSGGPGVSDGATAEPDGPVGGQDTEADRSGRVDGIESLEDGTFFEDREPNDSEPNDREPNEDVLADRPARPSRVRITTQEIPPAEATELQDVDTLPTVPDDDSVPSAPVPSEAAVAVLAAARREPAQGAALRGPVAAAATANAAPSVTASVDDPDPLSGVTRVVVTATDPDADPLTYTATRPVLGKVAGDGAGNFTYTPTVLARVLARFLPFFRSDGFSVTATDVHGGAASVRVNTTVVPINSAPRRGAITAGAPDTATGAVTGRAQATDPNRDSVSYLATTIVTAKGSVEVSGNGTFTYTPTAAARHRAAAADATAADKTDSFVVTVADKWGAETELAVNVRIGAANEIPTGTVQINDPDPSTAMVIGTVGGIDPDGDPLTYRGPESTLKGSVVVHTDGTFTYTPSAAARYYAAHTHALPYDTSDAFTVTIDDGHGGLTDVPVSVVIGPGAQPPEAPPLSTFCGCTLLPADTIFHADLRGLPAMPESDAWIELLGGSRGATLRAAWAGNEWMGSTGGIPVNIVGADHPTEDVVFNRGYSTTGPGIDDRPYAIPDRPLVEGMPSYPAWDRHLLVFQEGTCVSQELYNVANGVELPGAGILDILGNAAYAAIWGSSWIAEAGAQYDMSSPLYPQIGHANASRLPYLPMILRPDDLDRGYIDHMLGITIAKDVGAGYVWPARAGDGSASDGIPMGTVLRLRPDVDISGYAPSTQVILRALQVHGAVVYDSRSPGTDGAGILAMSNGWEGTDYVTAKNELNTIPINLFEAVDAASLALDPATGWQIR